MKKYKIFFTVLWIVSLVLIVFVQIMGNRAKNSDETETVVSKSIAGLDTYYIENNKMPQSLDDLNLKIDTSKVAYSKLTDTSYKLCASYTKVKADYEGNTYSNDIKLKNAYAPEGHPKGEVCYSYTEEDSRLINSEASSEIGADCTDLRQTSFQSEPAKITKLDPQTASVTIGAETYNLCRDAEIRDGSTIYYSTQEFGKLRIGDTVKVTGSDRAHITTVTVQ